MTESGTIILDIDGNNKSFENKMSFAPQLIAPDDSSVDKKLTPLVAWSYQGIWNRKSYLACKALYKPAAEAMSDYYKSNYGLSEFSGHSMDLIASYIHLRDSTPNEIMASPAFAIFRNTVPGIDQLKSVTKDFTKADWNTAVAMAILNHVPAVTIEWLLTFGADVNAAIYDEYPLMRAVEQPEIIALLLKKGANPEGETPYGKTALFYAVRYNQLETVKLLLSAGAKINHPIKKLEELKKIGTRGSDYLLEKVAEFTPLVYSQANAAPEISDYLKQKGATLGNAKPEVVQKWLKENSQK